MKNVFAAALLLAGQAEAGRWGFEVSTGPGYRQDRIVWKDGENSEVYPHVRMFDWALSFDLSLGSFHLGGEGDIGWFSGQEMRKMDAESFPAPVSFSYVASGRAATGALYAGYRFGGNAYFMPFAGWVYNSADLHRSNSIPPFERIEQNVPPPNLFADASIVFSSNLEERWQGPMAGGEVGWQPVSVIRFVGSYAYGWIYYGHSFSETDSLQYGPVVSTLVQTRVDGSGSGGGGHGNLGKFRVLLFLSRQLSLDFDFRYYSFQSGSIKTRIGEDSYRSDTSKDSSALVSAELSFHF